MAQSPNISRLRESEVYAGVRLRFGRPQCGTNVNQSLIRMEEQRVLMRGYSSTGTLSAGSF